MIADSACDTLHALSVSKQFWVTVLYVVWLFWLKADHYCNFWYLKESGILSFDLSPNVNYRKRHAVMKACGLAGPKYSYFVGKLPVVYTYMSHLCLSCASMCCMANYLHILICQIGLMTSNVYIFECLFAVAIFTYVYFCC